MLAPLRALASLLSRVRNPSRLALSLILLCLLAPPAFAQGEFHVWFHTLRYTASVHRFFFQTEAANDWPGQRASATCYINGGGINCPPGNLGSLDLPQATGAWSFHAVATAAGFRAETPKRTFVISADPPANTLATPKWFEIFEDRAKVAWGKSTDATGYKVQVKKCESTPCEAAQTLTLGDVAEANLKDASNCCTVGFKYQTRIQAITATSESAWSAWREFTYTSWPPLGFKIDPATAIASWKVSEDTIRGYDVRFQHGTDGKLFEADGTGINTITSVDLNSGKGSCCLNGEKYRAQIRTWVAIGINTFSKWSNWATFTFTGTSTVPPIPTGLAVSEKGVASWSAITSTIGTGYRVNLQAGTDGDVNTYFVSGLSSTSVDLLSGALPSDQTRLCCTQGATYRVNIEAHHDKDVKTPPNVDKYSPESAWVTFTFDGRPDRPTGLQIDDISGIATWVKSADASAYLIQLREVRDDVIGASVNVNVGDVNTVNFNEAPEATICCYESGIYEIRIQARNSYGASAFNGDWLRFTYAGISSIERPAFIPARAPDEDEDDSGGSFDSNRGAQPAPTRDPANLPIPTQDHSRLPTGAEVNSDSPWIAFSEVKGAGVGVRSVLDRGARQAIDVWGPLGVDAEVCFDGMGSLLLLDAAYTPRQEMSLVSYSRPDGKTCAQLDRAGTVVLMPGQPHYAMPATATPAPPAFRSDPIVTADGLIADDPSTAVPLANCHVGSFHVLNLRARPAGSILGWFHGDMTRALARTPNWFQINYNGTVGWISSHYAMVSGDCE